MPRYGRAEVQDAKARISALFGATSEAVVPSAMTPATAALEALVGRAEAKLEEAGEEDRNELVDLIEAVRDAAANEDATGLDRARQQLTDLLFYLET